MSDHNFCLAIVGCGVMGIRHISGLAELSRGSSHCARLAAIVDISSEKSALAYAKARDELGMEVQVYQELEKMLADLPDVDALSIVTDHTSHCRLACEALRAGKHVLVEKPMAVTVKECTVMIETAKANERVLAVAENVRRDPINRLARGLIQGGVIGEPNLVVESWIGGGSAIYGTPWRHLRESGGLLLDNGVHIADVLRYLLGEIESVFGTVHLHKPRRFRGRSGSISQDLYEKLGSTLPDSVPATAPDALYAHLSFENGTVGQWTMNYAAPGPPLSQRFIYGSKGCLQLPGDRVGKPIILTLESGEVIDDERILAFAPSYALDAVTAELMGNTRINSYSLTFPEIDRKLIAVEYADFFEAIKTKRAPEVDGHEGRRDVAVVQSVFESSSLRTPVSVDDVESGVFSCWQDSLKEPV